MNIEHLRYLIEIGRRRSITAAAKHLPISPQGLNKALGIIESEAGVKLAERSQKGITLTDEGRLFLEFAKKLCGGTTICSFSLTVPHQ